MSIRSVLQQLRAALPAVAVCTALVMGGAAAAPCATFKDAMGREVVLHAPPARIVTLAPSITETLYFLGLGDRVIGVTRHSDYPREANQKPVVGSYIQVNVEKIIALAPDLVIATKDGNEPGAVTLLEQAGIPVYVVNPRNVHEVVETVAAVGRVCGVPEQATDLAGRLYGRIDRIVEKTRSVTKPSVFLQINIRPIMSVNKDTFLHDIVRLAGGENIMQDEPITYPRINLEEVIQRKPEVIVISSMERGGQFEQARREWFMWESIPAVQSKRVYLVESDLVDRPSPRIIDGLEVMARLLHPEINWEVPDVE